ncbi:MAG: exopolysaccharide biosynthesis protein [Planctomycetaceae bacterium]|nr:exopolysaccharide biosynthesis protein [Planctomycetaceae bacterium]
MNDSSTSEDQSDDGELTELLNRVEREADGDRETIGEVLDAISNRGFGPLLLVPALLAISPLGAIPGMSVITGTVIFVISLQMLFRNDHPWIPRRLEQVSISHDSLVARIRQGRPWLRWIEYFFARRLEFLTTGPMHYVLAVSMMLLALSMFPLALVPFGVFVPGLAIAILAAGLTIHDGVLVLAGLGTGATAVIAAIAWWTWG